MGCRLWGRTELDTTEATWQYRWNTLSNKNKNPTDFLVAAAAKSLQPCRTLWDPIDGSPPGSPVSAILQARTSRIEASLKHKEEQRMCLTT